MKCFQFRPGDRWIWLPDRQPGTPGVVDFKREWDMASDGELVLALSADNRYRATLDGHFLGVGPTRGDVLHYSYEEYRCRLTAGKHRLEVEVYVEPTAPRDADGGWGEMHAGGGFLASGQAGTVDLSTAGEWLCRVNNIKSGLQWKDAWDCSWVTPAALMEKWDFTQTCGQWQSPAVLGRVYHYGELNKIIDPDTPWLLEPSGLPPAERSPVVPESGEVNGKISPPGGVVRFRFAVYQTGYPHLMWRGGAGKLRIAYAEALVDGTVGTRGYGDKVIFPAGEWEFEPHWYRAGQYIELEFSELTAEVEYSFSYSFSAYPFELRAEFHGEEVLEKIWEAGWRTHRCCAHEHYEDCPFYEQNQYVMDSRIQMEISHLLCGDARLTRRGIESFGNSQQANGMVQSRYPTKYFQIIPSYGLQWIAMIYDDWQYTGDLELVCQWRRNIDRVLDYFADLQRADGLLNPAGYWMFSDWRPEWIDGSSARGENVPEVLLALHYALALEQTAEMNAALGGGAAAETYASQARRVCDAVNRAAWSPDRLLYRDTPEREWYSQYTNALAILAGAVTGPEAMALAERITVVPITETSFFTAQYTFEVWRRLGRGDLMRKAFARWEKLMECNCSTFPEVPADCAPRSLCHAASATPLIAMVRGMLGVTPGKPGWQTVRIMPACGAGSCSGVVPVGKNRNLQIAIEESADAARVTLQLSGDTVLPAEVKIGPDSWRSLQLAPGERRQVEISW